MSDPQDPVTFRSTQTGYHKLADARREARNDAKIARDKAHRHEHDYRKALSIAFAKAKAAGKTDLQANIDAKAGSAHLALNRDLALSEAKAAEARLEELEADRASLRQLADWAQREGGDYQ